MARKSKAKFSMKGHSVPGVKGFKSTALKDGRAASSAFQQKSPMKQWTYPCPECGLEFETFPQLSSHIQSAHLGGGDPTPGPDRDRDFGPVEPGGGGGSADERDIVPRN